MFGRRYADRLSRPQYVLVGVLVAMAIDFGIFPAIGDDVRRALLNCAAAGVGVAAGLHLRYGRRRRGSSTESS